MRTAGAIVAFVTLVMPTDAGASAKTDKVVPPVPLHVEEWLGPDTYPVEAIRNGEEGRVVVALSIDATGKPVSCRNDVESGSPTLDRETCEIVLTKGRFEPARDHRGRPVAVQYFMPIRWKLPADDGLRPIGPIDLLQEATVSPDDEILSCTGKIDGKEQAVATYECNGPAPMIRGIRQALKLEGGYRLRAEHVVRHGDTPPPLPVLAPDARLISATEERQVVDAQGIPSACTVRVTGEEAARTREKLGPNVCDREGRFTPPTDRNGNPTSQHVLSYLRYTLIPPAN